MLCFPNYKYASTRQMSKLECFCLWSLPPFISADIDTWINKSLKSTLMVLPNNAKKLYDVDLVAHANKILLVNKLKLGFRK